MPFKYIFALSTDAPGQLMLTDIWPGEIVDFLSSGKELLYVPLSSTYSSTFCLSVNHKAGAYCIFVLGKKTSTINY